MRLMRLFRKGKRTLTSCQVSRLPLTIFATRRLVKLKCVLAFVLIILLIMFWRQDRDRDRRVRPSQAAWNYSLETLREEGDYNLSTNYFRLRSKSIFLENRFLVNNSKCRIPEVNIWNEEARTFLEGKRKPPSCQSEVRNGTINGLTFVRKQAIVISKRILKTLGLKLRDIDCCYQTIERIQQSLSNYTWYADFRTQFSTQCYPMTSVETRPISGFIKVTCTKKWMWFWTGEQIHTDFHLLATFESTSRNISSKLALWRNSSSRGPRPPNVLILGIDSTSRINFRRFMSTTRDLLEEMLGAVDMRGYTKVGENTYPNWVPLLSSYFMEELTSVCLPNRWSSQDPCPNIWKNFSAVNYVTVLLEDAPRIAAFNYEKTGFVLPPVDIYPRPWMMATYGHISYPMQCVDSRRPEQILIRYLVDLVELFEEHELPYFILSWINALTHDQMYWLGDYDAVMRRALETLWERGHLKNTLLFVMSDHGYRFLPIRRTTTGWFEDKLPALWIALPDSLKQLEPSWDEALRHNSKELTTPFDIHETLKNVLDMNGTETLNSSSPRGRSLFQKLSPRNCSEAWVPLQYCACGGISEFTGNASVLRDAAAAVMMKINSELPSRNCSRLGVGRITAAGVSKDIPGIKLDIGIRTAPEKIELEAVVIYNATGGGWRVVGLLRTDRTKFCELLGWGFVGNTMYCQCSWVNSSVANFKISLWVLVMANTFSRLSQFILM